MAQHHLLLALKAQGVTVIGVAYKDEPARTQAFLAELGDPFAAKLVDRDGGAPILKYRGDSDAHIVRGLIAILFAICSGKPARSILATDAVALFEQMGLREHLTPQRSNGFRSMVERIRSDARAALTPS